MNAQALFSIVSQWPKEAWPEGVEYFADHFAISVGWDDSATGQVFGHLSIDHAVMLFESAGLRWIYASDNIEAITLTIGSTAETHYRIELDCFQDPTLRNRMKPGSVFVEATTLIEAISQAIAATRKE